MSSRLKTSALALFAVAAILLTVRNCRKTQLASTGTTLIQTAELGISIPVPTPTAAASTPSPTPVISTAPKAAPLKKKKSAIAPVVKIAGEDPSKGLEVSFEDDEAIPVEVDLRNHVIVEGGAGFGAPSVDPSIDNSCCRIGLVAGVAVEIEAGANLSVVPGLRYGQRGGRATIDGSAIEVALDYLEAPLLLKYRFGTQSVKPFLIGGITPAYNLRSQGRAYGFVRDIKSKVSSFDVSVEAGFGVEIPVDDNWAILFSNRYTLGLVDIDTSSDVWRSRNLQILGGLRFTLP